MLVLLPRRTRERNKRRVKPGSGPIQTFHLINLKIYFSRANRLPSSDLRFRRLFREGNSNGSNSFYSIPEKNRRRAVLERSIVSKSETNRSRRLGSNEKGRDRNKINFGRGCKSDVNSSCVSCAHEIPLTTIHRRNKIAVSTTY